MPRKIKVSKSKPSKSAKIAKPKTVKQVGLKAPKKAGGTTASVFDVTGRSLGTMNLPKAIFGQKPNQKLLAQAIRVYFANQSSHTASTKTRAEVTGGGAKPWRQKHTGRARAGSKRSPLWVGGGIVFGPKPRKTKLSFPRKMKKKALISALSAQNKEGSIKIISGFNRLEPKTKLVQKLFTKLNIFGKTLLVLESPQQNIKLAARNIPDVDIETVDNLNAYKVIAAQSLLFSKGAIEKFK